MRGILPRRIKFSRILAFKLSAATAAKSAGKILVAGLFRKHPSAGNRWLAHRLAMEHTCSVSRPEGAFSKDNASCGKVGELVGM